MSDDHYDCEVNGGDLSMHWLLKDTLNARCRDGWRLHQLVEQRGNTMLIFERRG